MRKELRLEVKPLERVRVGFIGLGYRGLDAVERFTHIEDASIAALCDVSEESVKKALSKLEETGNLQKGDNPPKTFWGSEGWKRLCESDDIDVVYIVVPWAPHAAMSLYAMECGKHVAVEVPAAMTLEDCWALVDTSERTGRYCMMLENSVYDDFSLTCLNMVQQSLFGELVYGDGGYLHDFDPAREPWRLQFNIDHRGDLYPTHGLGPVALAFGINRGDRMLSLVSVDTASFNGVDTAQKFAGSPRCANGDHTTTLIRTQKGKVIELQHNIMDPRPYDRRYQLTGTRGYARQYPIMQFFFKGDDSPVEGAQCEDILKKYRHPISAGILEKARTIGHHDGMDYIMDYRMVYCLHHGLPLDMDVYDAALWSSIIPLSEQSILAGSTPVEIPDFTRGRWQQRSGVDFAL